jgi:hypothetical protein
MKKLNDFLQEVGFKFGTKTFNYTKECLIELEKRNGAVHGVIAKISGVSESGNKVSQSLYDFIRSMSESEWQELTGQQIPMTPREFLVFLYMKWKNI